MSYDDDPNAWRYGLVGYYLECGCYSEQDDHTCGTWWGTPPNDPAYRSTGQES